MRKKWTSSTINPISRMPYIAGATETSVDFDCDDFAYAFQNWATARGYRCWQTAFYWQQQDLSWSGHAINILEIETSGSSHLWTYLAFFEPQSSQIYAIWPQNASMFGLITPRPTRAAVGQLEKAWGAIPGTLHFLDCRGLNSGGNRHYHSSGEPLFSTDPSLVRKFEGVTKVHIKGWSSK